MMAKYAFLTLSYTRGPPRRLARVRSPVASAGPRIPHTAASVSRERCLASPDRAPLPRPGHAAHRVVQELRRGRSYGPTDPVHVECGDGACTARCTKLQASLGSFAAGTNQACSWLLRERTLHTTQYQPKQHPRRRSSTSRICSVIIHAAVDLTGAQMAEDEDEMNLSPLANLAGRA